MEKENNFCINCNSQGMEICKQCIKIGDIPLFYTGKNILNKNDGNHEEKR